MKIVLTAAKTGSALAVACLLGACAPHHSYDAAQRHDGTHCHDPMHHHSTNQEKAPFQREAPGQTKMHHLAPIEPYHGMRGGEWRGMGKPAHHDYDARG